MAEGGSGSGGCAILKGDKPTSYLGGLRGGQAVFGGYDYGRGGAGHATTNQYGSSNTVSASQPTAGRCIVLAF